MPKMAMQEVCPPPSELRPAEKKLRDLQWLKTQLSLIIELVGEADGQVELAKVLPPMLELGRGIVAGWLGDWKAVGGTADMEETVGVGCGWCSLAARVAAAVSRDAALDEGWELDIQAQGQAMLEHELFSGVESARRQERDGSWKAWAEEAVAGSAKTGHRCTAEPAVRVLRTVSGADGRHTACSQAVADSYGEHYSKLWGASATRGERPRLEAPLMQAGRWTAEDLRLASRGYSRCTAIGVDGFAMQHFGMLSDVALHLLGVLFEAVENSGQIPRQWEVINMALLPKAAGWGP